MTKLIFYHAGNFFSRDNIHPGMVTLHPCGFTHGPHPKALANLLQQPKSATDEVAVMIDARDPLDIGAAATAVEWAGVCRQLAQRSMKLASLRGSQRDGELVIVDRMLQRCMSAADIAPTLQAALDRWQELEPRLRAAAARLESGDAAQARPFDARACAAPLPRAYQWLDGSAYLHHVELVRKARGAAMPASFRTDPLMYQGGSDGLLGACEDAVFASEEYGIDLEAEVAVVTDDVPLGVSAAASAAHVKLIVLANDWSLRNLIPAELAKGFGFLQSKPATAFSAVAATPDELAGAWRDGKLHLPLLSTINGDRAWPARMRAST